MPGSEYSIKQVGDKFFIVDNATGQQTETDLIGLGNFLSSNYGSLKMSDGSAVSREGYAQLVSALAEKMAKQYGEKWAANLRSSLGFNYCLIQDVDRNKGSLAAKVWTTEERIVASGSCVFGEPVDRTELLSQITVNPVSGQTPVDVQTMNGGSNGSGTGTSSESGSGDGEGATPGGGGPGSTPGTDTNGEGANSSPGTKGGDPVILFSGAFIHQVTDLATAGRGLSVEFRRTYINQMRYPGPLGFNWDHNFNLYLREVREIGADGTLRNVVYRSTGALREDPYIQILDQATGDLPPLSASADAVFSSPPGYFDRLERSGGRYLLESPNGTRVEYGETLQAERIVDLNGNAIVLRYEEGLLTEIVDPVGKRFSLRYDELNRVAVFRDETGRREVRYSYTSNGDLEEVDLVFGDSVIGHDYRYTGPDAPLLLQHNLVAIIGPTGETLLETRYGEDFGSRDCNRVIYQRSEDGEYAYEYGEVTDLETDPALDPVNVAIATTRVQYSNGHIIEHHFNAQGNTVRRQERVVLTGGTPETLVGRYRYNADGLLIEHIRPDQLRYAWRYYREAYAEQNGGNVSGASAEERLSFGNLLSKVVLPRPGLGETRRIVTVYSYSRRNLLAAVRGPYYTDVQLMALPGQQILTTFFEYDIRGNLIATRYEGAFDFDGNRREIAPTLSEYNARGMVTATTRGGLRMEFLYFEDQVRSACVRQQIDDPGGLARTTVYDCDDLGRVTRTVLPTGAVTESTWNGFDLLVRSIDAEIAPGVRAEMRVTYNKQRKPVRTERSILLPDGSPHPDRAHVITTSYDAFGRRIEMRTGTPATPDLRIVRTVFSSAGLPVRSINARGAETRYLYSERMQVCAVTAAFGSPEAATSHTKYGRAGEIVETIDPRGGKTTIEYDGFGRASRSTTPEGRVQEAEYDAFGHVVRTRTFGRHPDTGQMLRWSESEAFFDAAGLCIGQVAHVFVPEDNPEPSQDQLLSARFYYDEVGREVRRIDQRGATTESAYDLFGRATLMRTPGSRAISTVYDDAARTVSVTTTEIGAVAGSNPLTISRTAISEFCSAGRLIAYTSGSGARTEYRRDSRNLTVATVRPDGTVHSVEYDVFGQPVRHWASVNGSESEVVTVYDAGGNATRTSLPTGSVLEQQFDARDRCVLLMLDGTVVGATRYDTAGNVVETEDANGVTTRHSYSPDGFTVTSEYLDGGFRIVPDLPGYRPISLASVLASHAPSGGVHRVRQGVVECSYKYDSLGRVVTERCRGRELGYGYDARGLASLSLPGGRRLRFDYSESGGVQHVRQTVVGSEYPGDPTLPAERDLVSMRFVGSLPVEIRYADSHVVQLTYDTDLRVSDKRWTRVADGSVLLEERIERGARSVVETQTIDTRHRAFNYDSLLRLVSVRDTGPDALSIDYELDENANRRKLRQSFGGQQDDKIYEPAGSDRYATINGDEQIYDRAGNLLSDGENLFHYDVAGRFVSVTSSAGTVEMERDPAGRIGVMRDREGVHEILYAGLSPVEWRTNGAVSRQLVPLFGPGRFAHVAAGGKDYAPLCDVMDSIVGWVSSDGTMVGRTEYDPFGSLLRRSGVWPAPFGYGGFLEDDTTPFNHLLARTYDPRHGRFLQRDPLGFAAGPNPYVFAAHAPVTLTDLHGFKVAEVDAADVGLKLLPGVALTVATVAATSWLTTVAATLAVLGAVVSSPALLIGGLALGAATLLGAGYLVYTAIADSYEKARKGGYGVLSSAAISVPNAFLPAMEIKEAVTGRQFGTDRILTQDERDSAVATSLLGGLPPIFSGARWVNGKFIKAPKQSLHLSDIHDPTMASTLNVDRGPGFEMYQPPTPLLPNAGTPASRLLVDVHGVAGLMQDSSAKGIAISKQTAAAFGRAPNMNVKGLDYHMITDPKEAAKFIVDEIGFKGRYLDFGMTCRSGGPNSFGVATGKEVATLLQQKLVIRTARGLVYYDPQVGKFQVVPWAAESIFDAEPLTTRFDETPVNPEPRPGPIPFILLPLRPFVDGSSDEDSDEPIGDDAETQP